MKSAALGEKDSSVHGNGSSVLQQVFKAGESAFAWMPPCAYRKSNPDIFVMQAAEDRAAKNTPCPLYGAR
jgi:hypothetical protein